MRLFIALNIPENIQQQLAIPGGSRPENLHVTLKFLGECPEDKVPALAQVLEDGARGTGPFLISLGNPGTFPGRGKPHTLWVGLKEGEAKVRELAVKVDQACAAFGIRTGEAAVCRAHYALTRKGAVTTEHS